MPSSEARIDANRQNAQSSTGPRTPAGKARSSRNACIHSLTAAIIPVLERDRDRFATLAESIRDLFQPANPVEQDFVEQMITARWHLLQVERVFAGYWDIAEEPDLPTPKRRTERHRCRALAATVIADSNGKNVLGKILRYEAAARRGLRQAEEALYRFREAAKDVPEECETNPTSEFSSMDFKSQIPQGFTPVPWPGMDARLEQLSDPSFSHLEPNGRASS
jgi:hypothetical protein